MRCLVLGGRGFIGRRLVDRLALQGGYSRIVVFDRSEVPAEPTAAAVSHLRGEFSELATDRSPFDGIDVVFHLVSTTIPKTSNDDPVFDIESNLVATVRLLEALKTAPRKPKIVFASSGGTVYGDCLVDLIDEHHPTNPICSYGIGKLAIEKYLAVYHRLHEIDFTILRVSNPYGIRQDLQRQQGVIPIFLAKALADELIEIWGDGSVVRDYVHVDDVTEAIAAAARYRGGCHVFNIGCGVGSSLNEILEIIGDNLGRAVRRRYIDARDFDARSNVLSIDLAARELGWTPRVSVRDGISALYRSMSAAHRV